MKDQNEKYIQECFELALKAKGKVSPNPYVGAIIVKNGEVISKGYHKGPGEDHAELDAIKNAKTSLVGATIFSNLEPCCHTNKRTPPCAQRLIKEGFKKVVISNIDPNSHVAGKGVQLLRDAGIEVITNILEKEGRELNEVFFSHITEQRPFVHLKYAQTLDGKMSTLNGDSKWITSQESRLHVHKQRALYDSILVGANTALKDDPKLTIRLDKPEYSTKRIILTNKKIENTSLNLLKDNFKSQTIQLIKDPTQDLSSTLQNLYENHDIKSIYVEGGAKTIELFLKENLFDKITVYIAPKILGQGTSPLAKENLTEISNSYMFQNISWEIIEDNVVMTAYRKKTCLQG